MPEGVCKHSLTIFNLYTVEPLYNETAEEGNFFVLVRISLSRKWTNKHTYIT